MKRGWENPNLKKCISWPLLFIQPSTRGCQWSWLFGTFLTTFFLCRPDSFRQFEALFKKMCFFLRIEKFEPIIQRREFLDCLTDLNFLLPLLSRFSLVKKNYFCGVKKCCFTQKSFDAQVSQLWPRFERKTKTRNEVENFKTSGIYCLGKIKLNCVNLRNNGTIWSTCWIRPMSWHYSSIFSTEPTKRCTAIGKFQTPDAKLKNGSFHVSLLG